MCNFLLIPKMYNFPSDRINDTKKLKYSDAKSPQFPQLRKADCRKVKINRK